MGSMRSGLYYRQCGGGRVILRRQCGEGGSCLCQKSDKGRLHRACGDTAFHLQNKDEDMNRLLLRCFIYLYPLRGCVGQIYVDHD